ncbi:hypothetical protein SCHPADRAFT_892976 [Schizopora paradoxa]|uniref:Uncharacterized protein n=1 Tax=Schizopora paradoxa TaxID=27342 RepID=A0A0H2RCR0_9AGAM|nr:hypothetical protein SCHPADRAFT_892976 [Schizopora paradoxa]
MGGGGGKRTSKPTEKALACRTPIEPPSEKRPRGRPRKHPLPEAPANAKGPARKKAKTANDGSTATDEQDGDETPVMKPRRSRSKTPAQVTKVTTRTRSKSVVPVSKRSQVPKPKVIASKFYDEPTADNFMETIASGVADGSLALSDSDYVESDGDAMEKIQKMLPSFTSTPLPVKKMADAKTAPPKKCRKNIGYHELEVQVHDGLGLRQIYISTMDGIGSVVDKAADSMKRDTYNVDIGYEAPWSHKVGTKKVPVYITTEVELDNFWVAYDGYREKLEKKNLTDPITGVLFINMKDESKPSKNTTTNARTTNTRGGTKTDAVNEPKVKAQGVVVTSMEQVQDGMYCTDCDRACYKKWNGDCATYTFDFMTEHAKMLARGVPGVVANKVPDCMKSKLLDYVRPGRKPSKSLEPVEEEELHPPVKEPQESLQRKPVSQQTEVRNFKMHLDFPLISSWLQKCEEHLERGRDKHKYTALAPVFEVNGCTRIDDILRMTTTMIKELAMEAGVEVTLCVILRVYDYAKEDVAKVARDGELV